MELIGEGCSLGLTQKDACLALGIADKTYRNWKKSTDDMDGRTKRTSYPSGLKFDDESRKKIIERYCRKDVCDLSLSQAFYKLLDDEQEYLCSLSTLYRIFSEAQLNTKRTTVHDARRRYRPTSYRATAPNQVWTWDITYFRTSQYTGKFYYAYVIIDVYSRYVIAAWVYDADNAEYAQEFLSDAFKKYGIKPNTLVVHSDNGASMKAAGTLALLQNCGVRFSHSRPRVSNDNPYSESFFRTLKYSGDYRYPAQGFESLTQAQEWLTGFVFHYNEEHRHRGIRMVPPGARFRGEDAAILKHRERVIRKARRAHPERWIRGEIMNCQAIKAVWLNPDNGALEEKPPTGVNQEGGESKNLFVGTQSRTAPICVQQSITRRDEIAVTENYLFVGQKNRGVSEARGRAP